MFSNVRSFFKATAIYGVVGSLRSFVELLLLPVYARCLLPAEFGVLDVVIVWLAIATLVVILELHNGAFRFYFDNGSHRYHQRLASTAMFYNIAAALSILAVVLLLSDSISRLSFNDSAYGNLFVLAAAFLVFNSLCTMPINLLRVQNRPRLYTVISLVQVSVNVLAILYLVAIRRMGIEGVILARLLATLPTIVVSLFIQRRYLRPQAVDFRLLARLARYSAPLIPAGAALWGINALNRVFLLKHCSLDDIGLFALAVKFTALITLGVIAFQLAWPQFAFANMNNPRAGRTFARIFSYCLAGATWMVLFLALFGEQLLRIQATPLYYPAAGLMLPLALGTMFYGAFYMFTTGMNISKKTAMILIPIAVAVSVNVILNVLLTPTYGVTAVAWITTATYLTMASVMLLLAQRQYYIPFEWTKLMRLAFAAAGVVGLAAYIPAGGIAVGWSLRVALFLGFPLALSMIGFFDGTERRAIARKLVMKKTPEPDRPDLLDETDREVINADCNS
ncbi:MAG: polysaccharide biosynthesis C-terminal domain-containing protein [Candidatus Zixiibacteriota bacterium]|nr:MAG: polysaccharide biosynthesis C-terminal domain-containing protein [candidate division Zixibacteria bacterium]